MKMKKLPSESNSEKGDRPGEGRLGECPKGRDSGNSKKSEATPHGRVTESKPSGSFFTTGQRLQADWNRPVRSRKQGGVGPGN